MTSSAKHPQAHFHPKTLVEIAMVLSTNSGSFPSNSHVSATFSIWLRFGEFWNPIFFFLILVAFITGNSSLEPLIEDLYAQIHVNLR